jgi:hypothetical protein
MQHDVCQLGGVTGFMKRRLSGKAFVTIALVVYLLLAASCSRIGGSADPGKWGYSCEVTYNALGGNINTREVRQTYYLPNSLVFEPSGTTNMLIKPIKDGYILAGWYKAKEDILDDKNQIIGYSFKPEDRWDFSEDRLTESITLYARWIRQSKVEYVDADTDAVLFSKNITGESPIQSLTVAATKLVTPAGYTLLDYFSDKACTQRYVFGDNQQPGQASLIPSDKDLYDQLYREFPNVLKPYDSPQKPAKSGGSSEPASPDPDVFVHNLGYTFVTDDPAALAAVRTRKNALIEESIANYVNQSEKQLVYIKFVEGRFIRVMSPDAFKQGTQYGFWNEDETGAAIDGYILTGDVDFTGVTVSATETFSGIVYGNGHTLKNISLTFTNRKLDTEKEKQAGLFLSLDGATLRDLTFDDLAIQLNYKAGVSVTLGALAVEANGATLENVTFRRMRINSGVGDNGDTRYILADLIAKANNCNLTNVKGEDVEITASEQAEIKAALSPRIIIKPAA